MSGDGDTRQVISSTTMDGSVSYLRFRTQGPLMTRPIPAPHAAATGRIGFRHGAALAGNYSTPALYASFNRC